MSINDKQNLIEFYIKSKIFDDAIKFSLIVSVINLQYVGVWCKGSTSVFKTE